MDRKLNSQEMDLCYDFLDAIHDRNVGAIESIAKSNPWLMELVCIPETDDTWMTSTMTAAVVPGSNLEVYRTLLRLGLKINSHTKPSRTTAVSKAVNNRDRPSVEFLLSNGADPNIDRTIIGALNLRPEETAIEYATLLIEHGCDLNRVFELYGDSNNCFTALDWADKNPKLSEFLRKHGAKTLKEVRSSSSSQTIAIAATKPSAASKPGKPLVIPFDEVVAYFEKAIGPANKKSLIQIVPTGLPIGIHVIPPAGNRKHMTLFTNGLSAEPMNVPAGSEEYRFAELYIDLPGDWKIKEVKDMQWAWPLYWLRKMAQYPHNAETWLGGPVALIANEEPPRPLYKGCRFTTLLLFADSSFVRSDGMKVHLYRMIPLTTPEREYEQKRGLKAFMQALDKHDVPTVIDMNRKPFA